MVSSPPCSPSRFLVQPRPPLRVSERGSHRRRRASPRAAGAGFTRQDQAELRDVLVGPRSRRPPGGTRVRPEPKRKPRSMAGFQCPGADLNHGHPDFQSSALPTELPGQVAVGPSIYAIGRRASSRNCSISCSGCSERRIPVFHGLGKKLLPRCKPTLGVGRSGWHEALFDPHRPRLPRRMRCEQGRCAFLGEDGPGGCSSRVRGGPKR